MFARRNGQTSMMLAWSIAWCYRPRDEKWAMMLLGFVGLGFMAYRRTKKSAAV
jgi:hypothetical protein